MPATSELNAGPCLLSPEEARDVFMALESSGYRTLAEKILEKVSITPERERFQRAGRTLVEAGKIDVVQIYMDDKPLVILDGENGGAFVGLYLRVEDKDAPV